MLFIVPVDESFTRKIYTGIFNLRSLFRNILIYDLAAESVELYITSLHASTKAL